MTWTFFEWANCGLEVGGIVKLVGNCRMPDSSLAVRQYARIDFAMSHNFRGNMGRMAR